MKFECPEMEYVKIGKPLLATNQTARPVEVGTAFTFKQDGKYLVTVRGNKVIIENGLNRKHGKWLQDCDYHFRCSVCGDRFVISNGNPLDIANGWNFCPNCGAKMDGDENS